MLPLMGSPPTVLGPEFTHIEVCTPAGLHRDMWSRPASGADAFERNTERHEADTAYPETYLEVWRASWGGGGYMQLTVGTRTQIVEAPENFYFLSFYYF